MPKVEYTHAKGLFQSSGTGIEFGGGVDNDLTLSIKVLQEDVAFTAATNQTTKRGALKRMWLLLPRIDHSPCCWNPLIMEGRTATFVVFPLRCVRSEGHWTCLVEASVQRCRLMPSSFISAV